jgi:membrane associated rhomboid family serine protease
LRVSVALLIFAVTIVVSLAALSRNSRLQAQLAFRPDALVRRQQWHTLVTHGFVHADFAHLAFNMVTFWFFAFPLERVLGSARFALLYFVALATSEIGPYRKHRDDPNYVTLGASGAITAVLFASIVYFPDSRLLIFPIPVPIPAPLFAVLYLAFSAYADRQQYGNVNHGAHIGGALTGLAFVALFDPRAYARLSSLFFG